PDGRLVAFLFTENARAGAGPVAANPTETGVIGERMDGQRAGTVDAPSGHVRTVPIPSLHVHHADWAPGGASVFVTAAAPAGRGSTCKLCAIDATSGAASVVCAPTAQLGGPRASPDGKSVAFLAGLMSDEGRVGGEVFVVPTSGGEPRNLTPGRTSTPSWLTWRSPAEILFAEYTDGGTGFASVDVGSGRIESLWRGPERAAGVGGNPGPSLSVARDGRTTAVVRQTFETPPEVWVGPVGSWTQVSRANGGVRAPWGAARSISWKNDGLDVQGWLVAPREIAAGKRHPMIVDVHGGPGAAWLPTRGGGRHGPLAFASGGYFVFLPHPRGRPPPRPALSRRHRRGPRRAPP